MARNDKVSIYNAATDKYGVVSRFIFEHPVYGQNLVQVEDNEVPCVDCGDEVSPPELPEEKPEGKSKSKSTKEDKGDE